MFALHPNLEKECVLVKKLGVCNVYLRNDKNFPWLILVPARENIREIYELNETDYIEAMHEVRAVTKAFQSITGADKMNVATLGNMVPQLHIHIIARFKNDAAWPSPVWSANLPLTPYALHEVEKLITKIKAAL